MSFVPHFVLRFGTITQAFVKYHQPATLIEINGKKLLLIYSAKPLG
jgi:hypothetical protein